MCNNWLSTLFTINGLLSGAEVILGMKINLSYRDIDMGAAIREVVDSQHWSYTEFAKAINCSRTSLYNLFNSKDISLLRLIQISKLLSYDFLSLILYQAEEMPSEDTHLIIPMRQGRIVLDDLPPEIVDLIFKTIEDVKK